MYLWIGLGIDNKEEQIIRKYCNEINKQFNVNENPITLPQHISLKTSFYTENYEEIIKDLKSKFINNKELIKKIYKEIDKKIFEEREIIVNKIYFGVSKLVMLEHIK